MSGPFQFGPVPDGDVIIISTINNQQYVLKPDPNSKYGLYLGINSGVGDFIYLTLRWSAGQYYLSGPDGQGLWAYQGGVYLDPNLSADITYSYNDNMNNTNTALYADNSLILRDANGSIISFPYKSPQQENQDRILADQPGYQPTYLGNHTEVRILWRYNIYPQDCSVQYELSSYLAYAGDDNYFNKYSTTYTVCTAQAWWPLCQSETPGCSAECYGSCDQFNICNPVRNILTCSNRNVKQSGLKLSWGIIIIIILAIIIILMIMGFLIGIAKKQEQLLGPDKTDDSNRGSRINRSVSGLSINETGPEMSNIGEK